MDPRLINYPLMLLGACLLGAMGGAIGNAIQEHDIRKSALGGLATGVFNVTVIYLYQVISGSISPR